VVTDRYHKRYAPQMKPCKYGHSKYWRDNPGKRCAYEAARRARKLHQRCTCCDRKAITAFYVQAQGLEVDHRQALALGGLHCLSNLKAETPADHKFKTAEWDAPLIATAKRLSITLKVTFT
jgi:hypothetical protein